MSDLDVDTIVLATTSMWNDDITIGIKRYRESKADGPHTVVYAALPPSNATLLVCEILNQLPLNKVKEVEKHLKSVKARKK